MILDWGLTVGNLNNLTFPKSSAVAKISPFKFLSTEFISEPSEQGGHIPCTGHPIIHVHVAHFSSLFWLAPWVNCDPEEVSK